MPTTMPTSHYDRFDASKNYEKHLFRAGKTLQSAELNEIQTANHSRLKNLADSIFKDGDVVRDARIVVNATTGVTVCESGSIYLSGAVRGIAPRTITIPVIGIVTVGVYLQESVISEDDDPLIRDPAVGLRNFQEAGAWRLKVEPVWGFSGDGLAGAFYPVYVVENGFLRAKEPPPSYDAVAQTLARYDRDSAGGTYVVSGFTVAAEADLVSGEQVYTVSEGRARVNGFGLEQSAARRLVYSTLPDLRSVDSEPHISTTISAQRIDLNRGPVASISSVHITAEKSETITHGGYGGCVDPLPDTSILSVLEVKQGATTYAVTTDFTVVSGQIDWSPAGAEPAPGSTYTVKYRHIASVTPTLVDSTGFTVTGAVVGQPVTVNYDYKLPRIDRLAISGEGAFVWIKGVGADWNPQFPSVPGNLLPLASIHQTWGNARQVANDGVRVVPMTELSSIQSRIDWLTELVAQQRLTTDANFRESGTKKGMFVDPFLSDDMRDAGIEQTAAVVDGELALPINSASAFLSGISQSSLLDFANDATPPVAQTARTGSIKINAYLAFGVMPSTVELLPSVDRWTEFSTVWAPSITRNLWGRQNWTFDGTGTGTGWQQAVPTSQLIVRTTSSESVLNRVTQDIQNLRQIDVHFTIAGFGPGETLSSVTFDGVPVTAVAP